MKKALFIALIVISFYGFSNSVKALEYYDKNTDVLLLIDASEFKVIAERKAEKIGLNSVVYDNKNFMFTISRTSYDEMSENLQSIGEEFDSWFSHLFDGTKYPAVGETAFLSNKSIYKTVIYTYDSEYIYEFNFYTYNSKQNYYESSYYLIVAEAQYQYMKTNHGNSNPPEYKNNMIVIDSKKGQYITKVDFTSDHSTSYLTKNLINIIGTILIFGLSLGILIYKFSKHIKINFINILGIGLIILQITKYFSINSILLISDRINPAYLIINFLYGIGGLIFIYISSNPFKNKKVEKLENESLITVANAIVNNDSQFQQSNSKSSEESILYGNDLSSITFDEEDPPYITARQILGYGKAKLYDPIIVLATENSLLFLLEIEDNVTEFKIDYKNISNITVKNNLKFSEDLEVNISKIGTLTKHWINLRTIEKPLPWIFINTQQFRDDLTRPKASYKTETIPSWEITIEYNNEKIMIETFNDPQKCINFIENKRNTNV